MQVTNSKTAEVDDYVILGLQNIDYYSPCNSDYHGYPVAYLNEKNLRNNQDALFYVEA